jgi:hypothetical protein
MPTRASSPPSPARRVLPSLAEAEVLRVAARTAEDAGDFSGALRLVQRLPSGRLKGSWSADLRQVVALPDDAAAQLAVWLMRPALRWAQERPAGELLERYARLLLTTLGVLGAERERSLGQVAHTDPVVLDAAMFDGGLFRRYLAEALNPAVLSRAGVLDTWPDQPASVWRLRTVEPGGVALDDVWSGQRTRSLGWPGAESRTQDLLVFGRLVPVPGPVGRAFALPPICVDQRCAVRLLRARQRGAGPEERLRAVARFRRRGEREHEAA